MKQAADKIPNPNILINTISRRVRQLTAGSRPLLNDIVGNPPTIDIALRELIEEKITWSPHTEKDQSESDT